MPTTVVENDWFREFKTALGTFIGVAEEAVKQSGGRLRLAINEADDSPRYEGGAENFLKLDEKRLGNDIEMYVFAVGNVEDWKKTLINFWEQNFLPIKDILPESYRVASERILSLSKSIFDENEFKLFSARFF
ncbi:MAG: hypothetical protein WCX27_02010 [Candidatus Paceibacterota bacterium]|jgi:hypothetical protein